MSYTFTFDLSKLSQALFKDIAEFSEHERVHEKIGSLARTLVKKFNVEKLTGLPISDSITVVQDLIDIHIKNQIARTQFQKTNKRALLLPHCCRKYMDSQCKATFDTETSSYTCNHCSSDCLAHQATQKAQQEHYDVYILPGASCLRKIFQKHPYEGVVGVACTDELRIALTIMAQCNIPSLGIPLIKNGCSATYFNLETLEHIIAFEERKTPAVKREQLRLPAPVPTPDDHLD